MLENERKKKIAEEAKNNKEKEIKRKKLAEKQKIMEFMVIQIVII